MVTTLDFHELFRHWVQLHNEEIWIDLYLEADATCSSYMLLLLLFYVALQHIIAKVGRALTTTL